MTVHLPDTGRPQMCLDLGLPDPAPEEWSEIACAAMDDLAASGEAFDSVTLTERGVPAPTHPNRWGALFLKYSQRDLITPVGHRRSRRRTRNGGDCRTWIGTDKARRGAE